MSYTRTISGRNSYQVFCKGPTAARRCVLLLLWYFSTCSGQQHRFLQISRSLQQALGSLSSKPPAGAGTGWPAAQYHMPLHHRHYIGYHYMLSKRQRQQGISHYGSAERLRAALSRALATRHLTVAVVGGSISAGTGAEDAPSWVDRLETYLKSSFGQLAGINITVNNGAVPGTTSSYMSACMSLHVPAEADIVLVEYSVNDEYIAQPPLDNPIRRPFERLLRKLLALPSAPAVILLHAYAYLKPNPSVGTYYNNAEHELNEFAAYYGLPALSVKGCCFEAMRQGVPGFQVDAPREGKVDVLKDKAFYYDFIHPDGNTGHRVMAELVIALLQRGVADILHTPMTDADLAEVIPPLPPPVVQRNYEALSDRCFIGEAFKNKAVEGNPSNWEWVNESKTVRPKWGYVSAKPGAVLTMVVNSTASSGSKDHEVLVQVAHLKSYEHMGKALLTCVSGCECADTIIDGHHEDRTSQLKLHRVYVSQHEECTMAVQVLDDSRSPYQEHKVKLAAVIVSEEAGEVEGVDNPAAVEHVHDISFRHVGFGHHTVFDIRNHI